jgi:ABC-type uncharacterized transport system auxiliary subunit
MQRIDTIGLTSVCATFTASIVMLALGGCDAFNRGAPAGAQYLLAPSKQAHVEGSVLGTAMVMRFSAIPPFDGRQFLYKTSDGSWRADAYNGFLSDPSDMICDAAARAMTQSGRFSLVGIQGIAVRADFMLDGVIDAFYADYSDPSHPAAVVEIRSYLLDGRGARTRMIAHMAGKARAPITGSNPVDVSDAFSAAVAQALDQIVRGLPAEVEAEKPLTPTDSPKSATVSTVSS